METLPCGFLALPNPGDRTAAKLDRKLCLLVLGQLLDAAEAPPRLRPALQRISQSLAVLARGPHKKAVLAAVGDVDVRIPALILKEGLHRRLGISAETLWCALIPQLLGALVARCGGSVAETLLWDHPVNRWLDVAGRRTIAFEPPTSGILAGPDGLEMRSAAGEPFDPRAAITDGRDEVCLFPITGDVCLAIHDDNPLSAVENHPEKSGNRVDLGGRSTDAWCAALAEAFSLIAIALPALHEELISGLQRIVPVGFDALRHSSASYRQGPGLIYLSLHPSPLTLAEAIIHESQHGKLNRLTWFDPVLRNGHDTWTTSPVRPDMRPLLGVLLAAHAFVPVAALHTRLAALSHPVMLGADDRRRDVMAQNDKALATVQKLGRPTELGTRVIEALSTLHRSLIGSNSRRDN